MATDPVRVIPQRTLPQDFPGWLEAGDRRQIVARYRPAAVPATAGIAQDSFQKRIHGLSHYLTKLQASFSRE